MDPVLLHEFLVLFKQAGEGCDCTIGCGVRAVTVFAVGHPEALDQAVASHFGEEFDPDGTERAMSWVKVYEIARHDSGTCWDAFVARKHLAKVTAKADDERRLDEAEFDRLRRKLGR